MMPLNTSKTAQQKIKRESAVVVDGTIITPLIIKVLVQEDHHKK